MGGTTGRLKCGYVYSNVTTSSPDCTLHTAVTHVIAVLEQQSLVWILMVYSHVSFANTHTLVLTAVHSLNALKDSMHAIMESYEVTPHIHQYFMNTFINCVILLPRWALLMLYLSESSNRHSSISFSNNVLVTHQELLPPSPLPPTSHQNSVYVSSTSGAHSGSHS